MVWCGIWAVDNGTEIHSVNVNEKLKNAVSKCLEEINSK